MDAAPPWLHRALPHDPRPRRLPGVQPLDPADWLRVDEAFGAQMALRDRLVAERPEAVLALLPEAREAALEAMEETASALARLPGYERRADVLNRPDGVAVALDPSDPMAALARMGQADICLMLPGADEYVLAAGALCFPASWTLSQKLGRPLTGVHRPVASYDADLARRVDRLFRGIAAGRPLWRSNALVYTDPALFLPRSEGEGRARGEGTRRYLRSERQCLLRLPRSGAVAFTIHTYLVAVEDLPTAWRSAFDPEPDGAAKRTA
ncbi:heme-dependent oxidative N-demethylase family protein [Oceaniglobus roseus]|uniref:heme-dependent oxidative N-demethylase family protein n=1 Tax=Oceaniglobus roseus TaxID=1737570 RepID=UPI000C7F4D83|nr:DUF3445 domain-containing protein [Kandeliimicrobium roseum]